MNAELTVTLFIGTSKEAGTPHAQAARKKIVEITRKVKLSNATFVDAAGRYKGKDEATVQVIIKETLTDRSQPSEMHGFFNKIHDLLLTTLIELHQLEIIAEQDLRISGREPIHWVSRVGQQSGELGILPNVVYAA